MDKSKQLLFGKSFGELHYRFGRTLDGLFRLPASALTSEHSYRLMQGFPDFYMTCVYRWLEWPIAEYISQKAIDIGKRLGKNTLLVPTEGYEEQFWSDAKLIISEIGLRFDQHIELDDNRVYIVVSSCNPRLLLDSDNPFLLFDVTELSVTEIIGFLSKLLDFFDVQPDLSLSSFKKDKDPSTGKALLDSRLLSQDEVKKVYKALSVLSEIMLVLDNLTIRFCGFQWPVEDNIKAMSLQIQADLQMHAKILNTKESFKKLKTHGTVSNTKGDHMIKILFLAANPSNTTRIRLDKEIRAIQQTLRQAEFRDQFEIIQYWAVRATDIQDYLLQHSPDVIHFSGHGNKANQIILEDDTAERNLVSARALSQLFRTLKDNIRCVLLNACYSEVQAQAIAEYVDCVIGMSDSIGDKAAISFATAFYRALGYGRDIKTAFDLGCGLIDMENLNQQDIPKLIALRQDPTNIIFAKGH